MRRVDTDKEFDPFIDTSSRKTKSIEINNNKKTKRIKKNNKRKIYLPDVLPHDMLELVLTIIFIAMLILTIFLGFKVADQKKNKVPHVRAEIVIPVLGKDTNNQISIDVSNMKTNDSKEYVFKVTNSKDKNVNPNEVLYALMFETEANLDIELYKNENKENILPANRIVIENKLNALEEQVDCYKVKIKAKENTNNRELITVKVVS